MHIIEFMLLTIYSVELLYNTSHGNHNLEITTCLSLHRHSMILANRFFYLKKMFVILLYIICTLLSVDIYNSRTHTCPGGCVFFIATNIIVMGSIRSFRVLQ